MRPFTCAAQLSLSDPALQPEDPGLAAEQLEWLTARMKASTADYLCVFVCLHFLTLRILA